MTTHPICVGFGECSCGQAEARLYRVPQSPVATPPMCEACLRECGVSVPETARGTERGFDVPAVQIDLGHDHTFATVLGRDEELIGWLHTHPDARSATGVLCQSFCAVRPLDGVPVHSITCADPLTLTPSLKCRTCGAHGDVTNGRWEPR